MMERLRSVEISVTVDTNKMTYIKRFDDVDEMLEWLDGLELGICPTKRESDVCNVTVDVGTGK
jgi:hypothetical protein